MLLATRQCAAGYETVCCWLRDSVLLAMRQCAAGYETVCCWVRDSVLWVRDSVLLRGWKDGRDGDGGAGGEEEDGGAHLHGFILQVIS